jgi:hypothetical protein
LNRAPPSFFARHSPQIFVFAIDAFFGVTSRRRFGEGFRKRRNMYPREAAKTQSARRRDSQINYTAAHVWATIIY